MADVTTIVDDPSFVSDACRYLENLLTEAAMRRKYPFLSEQDWQKLGDSELLLAAVELERRKRIRDGSGKREAAQAHIVRAPDVLASLMDNTELNPRYRVDSIKALDTLAGGSSENAPTAERYQIIINLDADTRLRVDKDRGIIPNDTKVIDHEPAAEKDHEPW
jgi:hypothetical protein